MEREVKACGRVNGSAWNNRKILETGNKYKCGKCDMWKNNKYKVKVNAGSGIRTSG